MEISHWYVFTSPTEEHKGPSLPHLGAYEHIAVMLMPIYRQKQAGRRVVWRHLRTDLILQSGMCFPLAVTPQTSRKTETLSLAMYITEGTDDVIVLTPITVQAEKGNITFTTMVWSGSPPPGPAERPSSPAGEQPGSSTNGGPSSPKTPTVHASPKKSTHHHRRAHPPS